MNIASHNSFSYIRPKKWWMRPFHFMGRCQRVDICKQYELGVRLFDLRVRFDILNGIEVCHGSMVFDTDEHHLCEMLRFLDEKKDCSVRVMLEFNRKPNDYEFQIDKFKSFCRNLMWTFRSIHFFGGSVKWSGEQVALLDKEIPSLDGKYSSVQSSKWDDLCPIWYAWRNNRRNIAQGTDKDYLFIDFVDIR